MTTNIRIISDNAAGRAKALTSINGFAGESTASMLNDIKTDVYRSAGKSDTFTMTWDSPQLIESIHWPYTNWSPAAQGQVIGYSDEGGVTETYNSGLFLPCPAPAIVLRAPWTPVTSASAYKHGGGAHGRIWMPKGKTFRRISFTINDPNNVQGYIECGRIVAGKYWEAEYNPEYGAPVTFASMSKQTRDGDTNLRTEVGGKYKKQQISFAAMNKVDRDFMYELLLVNGLDVPFIFALYPNASDPILERTHMMYAKLVDDGMIDSPSFLKWGTGLSIESV